MWSADFTTDWPNRFARLTEIRNLVESAYSSIEERFGHQLRCQSRVGQPNEILAKGIVKNVRVVAGVPSWYRAEFIAMASTV